METPDIIVQAIKLVANKTMESGVAAHTLVALVVDHIAVQEEPHVKSVHGAMPS